MPEKEGSFPRAKRSLGQNFLVDPNLIRKVAGLLHAGTGDRVLEIGSGRGALTQVLAQTGCTLFAVDKDPQLARMVKQQWPGTAVAVMDALDLDWEGMSQSPGWKVIGNLPYNIASPLIWECVSRLREFRVLVFTVQLEVAGRIVAAPGGRDYGALSVWVQSFARPTLAFSLSPHVFRPRPKVSSGVLIFAPVEDPPPPAVREGLSRILALLFRQRRKQIGTIFRRSGWQGWEKELERLNIDPELRPERLSPRQFIQLAKTLNPHSTP